MARSTQTFQRRGVSRVELVAIVVLAGLAMSLLIVALANHREHERQPFSRTQITNNVKQLSLACHTFQDAHKCLPPAFDRFGELHFPASIHVHMLPFMEQDELYKRCVRDGFVHENEQVLPYIHTWLRDEQTQRGVQNSAANLRVFSDRGLRTPFEQSILLLAEIEPGSARLPDSFPDGTSNTIVFTTKYAVCGEGGSRYAASPNSPFAAFIGQNAARVPADPFSPAATFQLQPAPADCRSTPLMAQSFSSHSITVGLADASVRQVSKDVSPHTWNAAMQPNDGIKLGDDW